VKSALRAATVAWLITAVYYFYQYTLRSAPAVMMPQLPDAFGLSAMGVASLVGLFYWAYSPFSLVAGVAMLPYTVIKEANPPELSGTSTGVVDFLNFTFSALLGPVFGSMLMRVSGGAAEMTLEHYQTAFVAFLYGVGLAIVLTVFLMETGAAARLLRAPVTGVYTS
jgi:sugar phosphate permease